MHLRIYRLTATLILLLVANTFGTVTNPTVFYDVKSGQLNYTFDNLVMQINKENQADRDYTDIAKSLFEIDLNGGLMPISTGQSFIDVNFELDINGAIQPK